MDCLTCGAAILDGARFCPSCGRPVASEAETIALPASDAGSIRRAASPQDRRPPSSGWLAGSDSISHGRFAPGMLLDGRYRIIGLLGRGGMGEVYRADDLRLGQPVALKLLPEDLRHDPVRLAQFHNEVRTARQVSHPNVCRVHDIGEAEGLLYLSMEYVDGEDLANSLRRIGRFPEDKAVDIARQLCAGLAAAHQRGVIHRDLKPANVMLDGTGTVRVMDFGLAAVGDVKDIRAGTPGYMAPEQLRGREVTARSDIFALGLVLYELFTGRRAFDATSVEELLKQHDTGSLTPPSSIVSAMDPRIERAILRCLEPDPAGRPGSALAVSAALPGGDPLAAALAAGRTPSPEMVAASGEGVGLSPRQGWTVFVVALAAMVASSALAVRTSPLRRIQPEYSAEILAQKAREAIHQLGYPERAEDEAYSFYWDERFIDHVHETDKPVPRWDAVLSQRPSPLGFWYRRSSEPLTALAFHTDLLTPGIVGRDDPPPIVSGMTQIEMDHAGRLTFFETIPAQHQEGPVAAAPVDWTPLFRLAGLDQAQFKAADSVWTWLANPDTRVAWTGVWPESGRPLRIEAAAFGGRPVAFMLLGPWQRPTRMPQESPPRENALALLLFAIVLFILAGAGLLARANLRSGRGDRKGATRLAACMTCVLLALWLFQAHLVASLGLLATFLIAVCTSVFYGVLLWTIYVALEPFVRRQWPQVLVSWTNVLAGRLRDPIVGRDVLIGSALGAVWVLMLRGADLLTPIAGYATFPGALELLSSARSTAGVVFREAPYAIRNVLLFFFLLFVLRRLLRNQWLAALAFASIFAMLNALGNPNAPWVGLMAGFLYFGSGAFAVLRWGLLSFAVGMFVTALLLDIPATLDTSAWYFGHVMMIGAIVFLLAVWGLRTSVPRQPWDVGTS